VPRRYEAIKRELRKGHPGMSDAMVKKHAAMIFNGTRKKGQKPVTRSSK
jgi:hypothetical protein